MKNNFSVLRITSVSIPKYFLLISLKYGLSRNNSVIIIIGVYRDPSAPLEALEKLGEIYNLVHS